MAEGAGFAPWAAAEGMRMESLDDGTERPPGRKAALQEAVAALDKARLIRADAELMAEIRRYIREVQDEIGALLDDLGG